MGIIRSMNNTYIKLKDKHKGEVAIILGSGPSLYDLCISDNFKSILDHVVISVNSSIMPLNEFDLDPTKHYWISCDSLCRYWSYFDVVKKSKCIKVVISSWFKYKGELENFL